MKLFKNPAFAVLFCLILILSSTCISAKAKMERRYDRICDELYEEVLDFADENGIDELKSLAREAVSDGDYRALIAAFNEFSSGNNLREADDVDEEILAYTRFLRKTQHFPARLFVDLLHIRF